MPFTLIKGAFRIVGASPDGDSIRFFADDPALVRNLPGGPSNNKPFAQLRIEAIDTLETHYLGRHQPLRWARAARDRLLAFVGIGSVQWDKGEGTVISADDGTRGYILCREREKNGRPVSFLFAGSTASADGSSVHLDTMRLRDSYNYLALKEGLAYPTYYSGLFADLRNELTAAVVEARTAQRGLWPDDRTETGIEPVNIGVIIDQAPILPKLFRRLSDFMATQGTAIGFKQALAQGEDKVWDLREQNNTHFDTFVEQPQGSVSIKLSRHPEELVFDPMPSQVPNHFAKMVGAVIGGEVG